MPEPIPKLPVQLIQHVAEHRHVTTFEPEMAIAKMKVRGFALEGWDAAGNPRFRGLGNAQVREVLVYEDLAD